MTEEEQIQREAEKYAKEQTENTVIVDCTENQEAALYNMRFMDMCSAYIAGRKKTLEEQKNSEAC